MKHSANVYLWRPISKLACFALCLAALAPATASGQAVQGSELAPEESLALWFTKPAERWLEALPVGNGRLGAMVYGGVAEETLQLNEDSMWTGHPDDGFNRGAPGDLERLRAMLFAGGREAEVSAEVMPLFSGGRIARSHQTAGSMTIQLADSDSATGYRRWLDLREGIVHTEFEVNGHRVHREVFASAPDQVLVMRIVSDGPQGVRIAMRRPGDEKQDEFVGAVDDVRGTDLGYSGELLRRGIDRDNGAEGQAFAVRARVIAPSPETDAGMNRGASGVELAARGAAMTILVAIETEYYGVGPQARAVERLDAAAASGGYAQLRARHVAEHRAWLERCELSLPFVEALAGRPLDVRLQAAKDGVSDPGLDRLMFQFGRYLLIASSRPGCLPANLQGLWNPHLEAPWNADYHININLQMNYWPAEVTNLAELTEPLHSFIDRLAERGAVRARTSFGCGGWVAPHTTDIWASAWTRATQPYWGFWHNGGGWLCQHLFDHYQFGRDRQKLAGSIYPVMRGAAEFYLDWLVEDPRDGTLVSGPSTSPENSFRTADGRSASVCMGPAMDQQIIGELFRNTLSAARQLGIDDDFTARVRASLERLAPGVKVAPDGRILEWHRSVEEVEKGHRHMSHLYALHPGDEIDVVDTPQLASAARKTLQSRLSHGGAGTGWSRAWMINFMARLHDGETAYDHLQKFLGKSTAPNLFDLHPPFQIDGNFGVTAGIAELLLQSSRGRIELLPALPKAWASVGSFRGLRARGGVEVDATWRKGLLRTATLRRTAGGDPIRLRLTHAMRLMDDSNSEPAQVVGPGEVVLRRVVPGSVWRLTLAER